MKYTCKFTFFSKKHYKFFEGQMGVIIDKFPDQICVFGTDAGGTFLCHVALGHPKTLKGAEYIVEFEKNDRARICVGELQIVIDFARKKCAANDNTLKFYGEDQYDWGLFPQDVQVSWDEI